MFRQRLHTEVFYVLELTFEIQKLKVPAHPVLTGMLFVKSDYDMTKGRENIVRTRIFH